MQRDSRYTDLAARWECIDYIVTIQMNLKQDRTGYSLKEVEDKIAYVGIQ